MKFYFLPKFKNLVFSKFLLKNNSNGGLLWTTGMERVQSK